MDYHSIHGYDVSSFAGPDTHRLPTVSASQALNDLQQHPGKPISTGLQNLDKALLGPLSVSSLGSSPSSPPGGIRRGQVTEIWGPPGAGRTAFGIQLAANAICDEDAVVWVDCFQPLHLDRFDKVLASVKSSRGLDTAHHDEPRNFIHYTCLTLPHLMALVSRPPKESFASNVSLVVISSASALLNSALPKSHEGKASARGNKGLSMPAKRMQVLQSVMNSLQKLAATRNCAVVLLSQCATKMQTEKGAALVPAVNATVWEQGVSTRLVLHRDWTWQNERLGGQLIAGIQKLDGKATKDRLEQVSAFTVEADGISSIPYDAIGIANIAHLKRKLEQTDLEIPASDDDEDYDFANEDEYGMSLHSRKWHGSEDIMLGRELAQSDEELEAEDEDGPPQSDGKAGP